MLTNLSWLDTGQYYPPKSELPRLEQYAKNEALFLSQHADVWQDSYSKLARLLRKSNREVQTVFNYHQLLSKKTADFVCGEPPDIEFEGDTDGLTALLRRQRFYSKLYEAIIDVSRYGNGITKIVEDRLTVVSPKYWFPVIDPTDLKQITHHVIAYPTMPDDKGAPTQLYVEIHTPGNVETRHYSFSASSTARQTGGVCHGEIGELLEEGESVPTALTDFAVQPLSNVTHSGSIYGLDDYLIINSIVEKLIWRLHCADTVLDKHSEPSISGPASALEQDALTGIWLFKAGNYFTRDSKDDPDVSYITWDGNIESNFKEIDLLFNQLYILSEMGAAFLEGSSAGAASSGTALKLKLVSPRIKAQRIAGINDAAVRTLIALLGSVNGIHVDADDLQLTWHDGLPDDPVEDANRRNVETGGKATKSQFSAIKERGLTDAETEAELEQMRLEAAANVANVMGITDPTTESEEDPFPADDEAV